MGLPITKYTLLKAVAENRDIFYGPYYTQKLKNFLRFKLYGIILHDPVFHTDFHSKLGREFEMLDYLTGQDFLFFGLSDSPQEWVRNRGYFKEYLDVFDMQNTGLTNHTSEDPGITAFTIAKALNIDYDDLPVILLTDDLRKKEFDVIKTSSDTLVEQLSKIGFFCLNLERPPLMNRRIDTFSRDFGKGENSKDREYKKLLSDINVLHGNYQARIQSGLADILSGILSVLAVRRKDFGEMLEAEPHMKSFLNEFSSPLSQNILFDHKFLENKLLALAGLLANLRENQYNDFGITINQHCEDESHTIIRTFNKIYPKYDEIKRDLLNDLDYSPLLMCIGKVFEKELNLSVVHWVRNLLGLEMPDFFNKRKITEQLFLFSPSAEIIKNPEPVNFNGGFGHKWHPPFIGASEYVFKTLLLENKVPEEISEPSEFVDNWRKLRLFRNKAAHPEVISQEVFEEALRTFQFLNDSGRFEEMNLIKGKLKGENYNNPNSTF